MRINGSVDRRFGAVADALRGGRCGSPEALWVPGTAHGYHAQTFGSMVGEIVRPAGEEAIDSQVQFRAAARRMHDTSAPLDETLMGLEIMSLHAERPSS